MEQKEQRHSQCKGPNSDYNVIRTSASFLVSQ